MIKDTTRPEFIRRSDAARYLSVSPRTISEWQHRRLIPFLKVGRKCVLFRVTDLDDALDKFEIKAVR